MACSCLERPLREIYAEATLVFRGELVKARPHPTDLCGDETLTFVPNKIWKGESLSRYVIRNGSIGRHPDGSLPGPDERVCMDICPVFIEKAKEYIVFAFGAEPQISYCTAPIFTKDERTAETIATLDEIAAERQH